MGFMARFYRSHPGSSINDGPGGYWFFTETGTSTNKCAQTCR